MTDCPTDGAPSGAPHVNPAHLPAEVRANLAAQTTPDTFALESPEPTGKAPAVELIDTLLSRGWKKGRIAEAISVHPAQVTRVVKGEQTPSPETYKRLVTLVESGARPDDPIAPDTGAGVEPIRCAATVDLFEPAEDPAPAGEAEEQAGESGKVAADPLHHLPEAMRPARRWLVWKLIPNPDPAKKGRKVPFYCNGSPRNGTLDTPEDRAQLVTLAEARAALETGAYTGLGFALGPDEDGHHWQGIDLDGTDTRPELEALVALLPGYVERSPSGKGWHAIGIGRDFATLGSNATGIEAYAHGRYFTVTGTDGRGDLEDIADFVTTTLSPLHSPRTKAKDTPSERPHVDTTDQMARDLRSALASMRSDDRDLWVRMGLALKPLGDQGRALWLEWSQTSEKFDPRDAARVWESFKPEGTGPAAVFAEAQRAGWVNPAKGRGDKPQSRKTEKKLETSETSDPSATRVSNLRDTSAIPPESGAIPPESFRGALTYVEDKGKGRTETKRLIDSHAAMAVAHHLRGKVAWDTEAGAWLIWSGTHWEPLVIPAKAEKLIADAVEDGCHPIGYRVAYLMGISTVITRRHLLAAPEWPSGVVPFENGLLDLETRELRPATPGRALDWCLPWRWNPKAGCPTIKAWLQRSVNGQDAETVELLRAWLAALVRGLELQFFLTLIGRGGSGKGTFQRLAAALVGIGNVAVTDLARLETNRFETAKLYGKRLAMINEAGKYGGSVDVLKAVTGGDHIPLERKHQQQSGSFRFRGLVLMATNEPIIATDSTSGLERRRITVRFPYSATPEEKAEWDAKGGEQAVLHAEIPGLIRWLLDMPVAEIKARLSSPPSPVITENMLGMAAGNSVAEWLIENCVPVASDKHGTQIGLKSSSREVCLYPNYLHWCEETGRNHPVSIRKFSDTVTDIAEHLGHVIRKDRGGETRAAYLFGLRLRAGTEEHHDWTAARRYPEGSPEVSGGVGGGVKPAYRMDGGMEGKTLSQKNAESPNARDGSPRKDDDEEVF